MAVIRDTGAVYALYDADDRHHTDASAFIESESGLRDCLDSTTGTSEQSNRAGY